MAKKKPVSSVGLVSGFPYAVFWEEFGEPWEGFHNPEMAAAKFERLLADGAARGSSMPEFVTRERIGSLLALLELAPADHLKLTDILYGHAAEYLIPQVRKALQQTPIRIEKGLAQLARKATVFADALEEISLDAELVLGVLRSAINNPGKPGTSLFHFNQMVAEARDLAKAAKLMADEMPRKSQGTSPNLLEKRWFVASMQAIDAVGRGRVEILQADAAGRNPRPKGISAEVLFSYTALVAPEMPNATKVRLILEIRRPYHKAEKMWAKYVKNNI